MDSAESENIPSKKLARIPARIDDLSAWIAKVEAESPLEASADAAIALEKLQSSYEELRVAEEELLLQHEELLASQRELEAERQRYQELFNLAPDAYIVTDKFGMIREANEAATSLLGLKHRFLLGKPLGNFVTADRRTDFRTFLLRTLAGLRMEYQTVLEPRGRERVPVSLVVSISNPDEEAVLRWAIRDRTEWTQAETLLHDLNQLLSAVVQSSPVAIVVLDTDDNVTLWNPAAEKMFGWTAMEVVGKPLPNIPRKHLDAYKRSREEALLGKSHRDVQTIRQRKDGSIIEVALWTAPLRSQQGIVIATMGLVVDVTDRRETEERRRKLHQRVVTAQEDERRRISRELHDHVGQHLTAILLGLKSLQADGEHLPFNERRGAAEKICHLQKMVDDMMRDTHQLAWDLRPTALDDMGLEVALRRYIKEWSEKTGIAAEFQCAGADSERLHPDGETALYRVAQETLTNVARHSQASNVSVVLECTTTQVRLVVEDDGIGFEAGKLKDKAWVRLGVTGMEERLLAVGGDLQIESRLGKGTTVFARVPR